MYDLIVIGAGPAGSSAARVAAQHGMKTLLLEKDKIPRNKLCGGGLTPKVFSLFDFSLPKQLIERTVKSTRIHVDNQEYHFDTDEPLTYMTTRAPFDAFLTEKAVEVGTELIQGTAATKVETNDSFAQVRTKKGTYQSKLLIGADGMGGPTARCLNHYAQWSPDQVSYAIESEVKVGEKKVLDFLGDKSYFDLYYGVSPAGYGWVFPKGDHLTVGVGCRLNQLRSAQELFDRFVNGVHAISGYEIPRPQAHLIPLGGIAKVPTISNRVMLAGDSAGFAEPFFGEGIYFSILGGQMAARVAATACKIERYDASFLKSYEREWMNQFGKDFDVAFPVASFSYLEHYDMDRVARFLFSDKRVQECIVGLMDGSLRYRDAELKLAWPYFKYRLARLGLPFYR